ncbi:MAG: Crp/Fnr family transcriptional regulator [Deltaproteobacteria bacterium]|nr:Crp/Fnr family transcriptional regulator [Deltaproteobacteria bacterium]
MDPLWSNIFRKKLDEDSLTNFLKNLPTFSGLRHKDLRTLEAIVHQRNYKPNELVFEEGDPGSGMYMIRGGSVRIFARLADGGEDVLAILESGDFFGETTLTAPAARSASARTMEATELVGLFRSDLLELSERQPSVANNILFGITRVISERLQASSIEIRRLQNQLGEHSSPEGAET